MRTSNFDDNSVLKAAASITIKKHYYGPRIEQHYLYGDHLDSLINHFDHLITGPTVAFNELTCKYEWLEVKLHYHRGEVRLSAKEFWQELFTNPHYSTRRNLLILIELCLVMPIQAACCERGNSCLPKKDNDKLQIIP